MSIAASPGMSCDYFRDGRHCRCTAVEGELVPSLHERELFCRSSSPERCPTHQLRTLRGAPLTDDEYLQLWIPAAHEMRTPGGADVHAPPR